MLKQAFRREYPEQMSRSDSEDLGYDGIRVVFGSDTSPVAYRGRIQANPLAEELNGWVRKNPKKCLDMSGFFLYYTIYYCLGLRWTSSWLSELFCNSLIISNLELLLGHRQARVDPRGRRRQRRYPQRIWLCHGIWKKSAECLEMSIFLLYYTIIYSPFAAGGVWSSLL